MTNSKKFIRKWAREIGYNEIADNAPGVILHSKARIVPTREHPWDAHPMERIIKI
jgi:hypothetical protein